MNETDAKEEEERENENWRRKSIRFEKKEEQDVREGELCAREKGCLKLTC
jgi:hypothetical protein